MAMPLISEYGLCCSMSDTRLRNGPTATADKLHNGSLEAEQSSAAGDGGGDVNGDVTATSVVECDSFCDFVRFEGTITEQSGGMAKRWSSEDSGSGTLLRACIEQYKLLFEAVVAARILQYHQSLTASFIEWFVSSKAAVSSGSDQCKTDSAARRVDRVELTGLTKSIIEAFSLSCQLLVDFSALPIYTDSAISSPSCSNSSKEF